MPSFTLSIPAEIYTKLVEDAKTRGHTDRSGEPSPAKMAAEIVKEYYEDD